MAHPTVCRASGLTRNGIGMKVLGLRCTSGHDFEGWFDSGAAGDDQLAKEEIACPMCGSRELTKLLSAPRLNLARGHDPAPASNPPSTDVQTQASWMRALRKVMAETEDVGQRFAREAREMHNGEVAERPIRGQATADEARALIEDGIPVMPLPASDALKETLH